MRFSGKVEVLGRPTECPTVLCGMSHGKGVFSNLNLCLVTRTILKPSYAVPLYTALQFPSLLPTESSACIMNNNYSSQSVALA